MPYLTRPIPHASTSSGLLAPAFRRHDRRRADGDARRAEGTRVQSCVFACPAATVAFGVNAPERRPSLRPPPRTGAAQRRAARRDDGAVAQPLGGPRCPARSHHTHGSRRRRRTRCGPGVAPSCARRAVRRRPGGSYRVQVPIDTQVPQEQTTIGALDSEGLEGNSADAMVGPRTAPAKRARDAGTPPPLLREQSVASRHATGPSGAPRPRTGTARSPGASWALRAAWCRRPAPTPICRCPPPQPAAGGWATRIGDETPVRDQHPHPPRGRLVMPRPEGP